MKKIKEVGGRKKKKKIKEKKKKKVRARKKSLSRTSGGGGDGSTASGEEALTRSAALFVFLAWRIPRGSSGNTREEDESTVSSSFFRRPDGTLIDQLED